MTDIKPYQDKAMEALDYLSRGMTDCNRRNYLDEHFTEIKGVVFELLTALGCEQEKRLNPEGPVNSPEIPDGWKLVPIEPTESMVIDGFESEPDKFFSDKKEWKAYKEMSGCQQAAHRAKLCWAAMIAAAPKPE
ncbi:Uncharacterised protein [Serratia quinivorans]|uniref:hypothetical protein n=1 Tax=Serratia quinivorans TaxID=137545 RepID=UPI00217C3AB4|nr:hypothetical protein [Serratia quinivorans]CAI1820054.1 Uncharacterised protein [Serratia quinivorans]